MGFIPQAVIVLLMLALPPFCLCQVAGFTSIDCGGTTSNYTDPTTGLSWISDAGLINYGVSSPAQHSNLSSMQYQTRRDFPTDDKKYCYTLQTEERRRYLVRATFLYGDPETQDTFPKFELYLDATKWTTVNIYDASRVFVKEVIVRAPSKSLSVCLCCATTGSPFMSTLELRPLNLSMYATDFENDFFLEVAARVNFGALTVAAIRYPDDAYDRIWESDLAKRPNFLVGVASGTERISTSEQIDTSTREYPPVKVMQTAVVGTKGLLSYRLNLDDFPANARAYAYFAEIEDLGPKETRKFKLKDPDLGDYNNAVVNIVENANGSYRLYEPSYMNVSLSFILSFSFQKMPDSARGPLLNAMEISRYVKITQKTDTQDVMALNALLSMSNGSVATDQGDPCLPVAWEWVSCSSTAPPRITKIALSGKDVKGVIPCELNSLVQLTELWLDGNSFSGSLPDMSSLINLKILHLENNDFTGPLPSYLGTLPSLHELNIENNSFSGEVTAALLSGKIKFRYGGNPGLHKGAGNKTRLRWILGAAVGALAALVLLLLVSLLLFHNLQRRKSHQKSDIGDSLHTSTKSSAAYSIARGGHLGEEGVSHYIALSELELATENFSKKVGRGSFGSVYYGRMKDGKEVAVKIMADSSSHGQQQFVTEVALLSRIHHRNLVPLIGYCKEEHQRILVYEYMHNGTLRDHIHDSAKQKQLNWLTRLKIAEDAAKGLDYLHTGCNPSIIHRDVKTSNILLDMHMRAKVSDFGLSKQAEEDLTHVSSVARGTVGYVDPEYYGNQQLTEKSDVYSFGVVLLELISGRKPVSVDYGSGWNIVYWARSLIRKGDVMSMVDPVLMGSFKSESIWRIAEVAIHCVEQHGVSRPRMQEITLGIQDAIKIEKDTESTLRASPGSSKTQSSRKTLLTSFLEVESPDLSNGCIIPSAR